jgi:Trk K+ transport system NAD-binding subunit
MDTIDTIYCKLQGTEEDEKVIIEEPVEIGSAACGMKAEDLSLPAGCVLVTIKRDGGEIIPDAETELRPLDVICVLCMKNRIHRVQHMLDKRCRA